MFIQDFKKLRLVLLTLATVGLVYIVLQFGLGRLSYWAESEAKAFPYQAGEDPIRYLLPTLMTRPVASRMLLLGASETGENMLFENFQASFPDQYVYPGGLSTGTVDDLLVVLEYHEEVYGAESIPATIVVGLTVRMVANMPRRFGEDVTVNAFSPLFSSIDQYSRYFDVVGGEHGSELRPKSWLQGEESHARFMVRKQQPRYRAALTAWLDAQLEGAGWDKADISQLNYLQDIWNPLNWHDIPIVASFARKSGWGPSLRLWLSVYRLPYQTQYSKPVDPERLSYELRQQKFWQDVYEWDPGKDAEMVREQLSRLKAFADKYEAELYVVNMPENPVSRQYYKQDYYNTYLKLVKGSLPGVPFLDLNAFLDMDEFVDETHATLAGAERVTAEIIQFIREQRRIH